MVLIIYVCTYQSSFEIVILVRRYEQDKLCHPEFLKV
jgi:hypothetical protein